MRAHHPHHQQNEQHDDRQAGGLPGRADWRHDAACRDRDPELFFPAAETGPAYDAQAAAAVQVCAGCPVVAQCRAWALDELPHGVAGGLDEHQRRRQRTRAPQPGHPPRRRVAVPVDASPREFAAAGRAAAATGEPTASVAARFGVDERTAQRWHAAACGGAR